MVVLVGHIVVRVIGTLRSNILVSGRIGVVIKSRMVNGSLPFLVPLMRAGWSIKRMVWQ